jgi:signal transduction histidine kinase
VGLAARAGERVSSEAIAGFLSAWVLAYTVMAAYCFGAWARGGAPLDTLVFGLLATSLSVLGGGTVALELVADPERARWALAATSAGKAAAAGFLLHFAGAYTGAAWPKRALFAMYAALGGFIVLSAAAELGNAAAPRPDHVRVAMATLAVWTRSPGAGELARAALLCAAVTGAAAMLARSLLAGRRDVLPAVLGTAALVAATVHDAAYAWSGVLTPIAVPHGYAAFSVGVVVTMLSSYAALRRQLERRTRELKRRSREVGRSYQALKTAQAELVHRQQLAAIGELSAVVAHEVRNPLAIITTAVATLRRETTRPEERGVLLGILDEEVSRLNRLVGDLLVYAKPVNVERSPVALRELAERALTLAAGRAHVTTAIVEGEPVSPVTGDPNLLRQAVDNLVANALQAMPDGGVLSIELRLSEQGGVPGVELAVVDTGEGMSTAVRSRAGDPFFTTRPSGTGLGLAIVGRIVRAHGGKLRIESAAGEGTAARIFLPEEARADAGDGDAWAQPASAPPPLQIELREALGELGGERKEAR